MTIQINTHGLLSAREELALHYVAEGKTIKDAARVMRISRGTTYEHIDSAKIKLAAETTPHAISLLWQQGHLRRVALIFLALSIWSPIRISWLDSSDTLTRTARTTRSTRPGTRTGRSRNGKARRRNNKALSDTSNALIYNHDTGEIIWPEIADQEEQAS